MGKKRAAKRLSSVNSKPIPAVKANAVVLIASFCALTVEIVAGRILAPHLGVSLYTWTSIIGVVLAGISLGAYLGGWVADRYPRASTLGWLLFVSGLGVIAIAPLTRLFGNASFGTSLMVRILLVTSIIFFVPSLLLGMISPVVVRLRLASLERTGSVVGRIYAFSTLGSILGTFTAGFFLISWIGTRNILLSTGSILLLSAPVFGGAFIRKGNLVLLFLILIPVLWGLHAYAFKPSLDEDTFFFKESSYYTIQLKKNGGDPRQVVLYLDNLTHSCSDLDDPFTLVYRYIQVYEEVVRWQAKKRGPFRALFIGGGGYTFPRYLEAKFPGAQIDVVEIDPEITRVSLTYMGVPKATKIRTFNTDARWFVMTHQAPGSYDFIFMDAFNDLSIPYHLTTREFSLQLKTLLKPDGLLIANIIDNFSKGAFLPSYTRTLEKVFGEGKINLLTLSPSEEYIGLTNSVVVASPQSLDMDDFIRIVRNSGGGEMLSHVMAQDRLRRYLDERSPVILTDDYVPVDNLIAPAFEEAYGGG